LQNPSISWVILLVFDSFSGVFHSSSSSGFIGFPTGKKTTPQPPNPENPSAPGYYMRQILATLWAEIWEPGDIVVVKLVGYTYMGVSKNRGTPKWMVYNGKPY